VDFRKSGLYFLSDDIKSSQNSGFLPKNFLNSELVNVENLLWPRMKDV